MGTETKDFYLKQGIGSGKVGFGRRPAVLVVDMQNDFVDPGVFLYLGEPSRRVLEPIQMVLTAARRAGLPIVYTQQIYKGDLADAGCWPAKFTGLKGGGLREGTPGTAIVPELAPQPGDYVMPKRRPSAFFATDCDLYLRSHGVDTLIVTGCTTSGCIRATVIDAFSYNYRTIIPAECVADRAEGPHHANLFDMGMKYADVVTVAEVLAHLER